MDGNETTVRVGVVWLGSRGFFISLQHDARMGLNALEWRYRLLAWHESSYYGTFVETGVFDGKQGFFLTPAMGLEFLAREVALPGTDWTWDESALPWRQGAVLLEQQLAEGRWRPEPRQWQETGWAWTVEWPEESKPKDFWPEGDGPDLTGWLNEILAEWIRSDGLLGQAWQDLQGRFPLLQSEEKGTILPDQEWLEAVGWQVDAWPFRVCLRLVEPVAGELWRLEMVLQDRFDEGRLVVWPEEKLPAAWLEQEEDAGEAGKGSDHRKRIAGELAKWLELAPWLEVPGGSLEERLRQELTTEEAWRFMTETSLDLGQQGCTVFLPRWWEALQRKKPRLKIKARSSRGSQGSGLLGLDQLVNFDWRVAIGDVVLSEEEFRQLAERKGNLMRIRETWVQLDFQTLKGILEAMAKRKDGASFGDLFQTYLGQDSTEGDEEESEAQLVWDVEWDAHWDQVIRGLTGGQAVPLEGPPESFRGQLRHYQQLGMSWMLFLRRLGLGGCLADDMGLGKTIQWIAYLLKIQEEGEKAGPSLLICPTSVLGNWQKELERFAPSLRVHLHYGPQRLREEALAEAAAASDLVITTYALAHLDQGELAPLAWDCLCLDEAQNIKNSQTKQAAAVRGLIARHRLALTGTPMENRLTELWSIMNFLNPGYLGSLAQFSRRFSLRGEEAEAQAEGIRRLVRPFLLRRIKSDPAVELDLPEKQEIKAYLPLTPEQATLYERITRDLFDNLDEEGGMARRGRILGALNRLKQVCDHPDLLLGTKGGAPRLEGSNKLQRLLEMVGELRAEGDQCLIFTQYLEMGRIIQRLLEKELQERVFFFHGGTPQKQREEMVEEFQQREGCKILILSLKAGGVGLNLTAASHVFHYDRWWNPAVENQASDRAHRIGQKRHVQVHKLISVGTLEERIDQIIESKQGLNELIVGGGEGWLTEFSTDQLRDVFALRQEWISRGEEDE